MSDDRRSAPRANLTGVRASFESASGDPQDAPVTSLGVGGLFLVTDSPLPVGKRLSLELHVAGEAAPWSALGRVVWTRAPGEAATLPAGMGIKWIDIDESVVGAIARLVATREPTEPGVGDARGETRRGPSREKTMLGVGVPGFDSAPPGAAPQVPLVSVPRVAPPPALREPLTPASTARPPGGPASTARPPGGPASAASRGAPLPEAPVDAPASVAAPAPSMPEGVATRSRAPLILVSERTPEPSLAIELVAKRVDAARARLDSGADEPIRLPKHRGGRRVAWALVLALLGGGGGAGYVHRARIAATWHRVAPITKLHRWMHR